MLTRRQYELLRFIDTYVKKNGFGPTFAEMAAGIGTCSKSSVDRHLLQLELRGFIRRLSRRARAIEVIRLPEVLDGSPATARRHSLQVEATP